MLGVGGGMSYSISIVYISIIAFSGHCWIEEMYAVADKINKYIYVIYNLLYNNMLMHERKADRLFSAVTVVTGREEKAIAGTNIEDA